MLKSYSEFYILAMEFCKCIENEEDINRVDRVGLVKTFGKSMFCFICTCQNRRRYCQERAVRFLRLRVEPFVSIVARPTTRVLLETTTKQQLRIRLHVTRC